VTFALQLILLLALVSTVVPASSFTVLSGTMTGNPDGSISANTARVRAVMNGPVANVSSVTYSFRIFGSSPTVNPDADGIIRQGVVLWINMQNACNLYFLHWRTASNIPAGTTLVGAKVQYNPGFTILDSCAGIGYSTVQQPGGAPAEVSSNINIMDGNQHNFTVTHLGPSHWKMYTDGIVVLEALDMANTFPVDSNLYGLRLDGVNIQLSYILTTTTTVTPPNGNVNLYYQTLGFGSLAGIATLLITLIATAPKRSRR
jgi:hypothetical protein